MLATSFRASAAKPDRHILYFALLEAHTGFDYKTSLKNFLDSDGWNTFSQEEKNSFMSSFESVKKHAKVDHGEFWQEFHDNPALELDTQLYNVIEEPEANQEIVANFESKYGPLIALNQQQFLLKLNEMHPFKKS